MLRLLFRYTIFMYPQIACRIRFSFALFATYASSLLISLTSRVWQEHKELCWCILVLGSDTDALPTYYKLFDYVVLHRTYSISSYLLSFSPFEKANIFSDQVVLFRAQLMRLLTWHWRVAHRAGSAWILIRSHTGVINVYRLPRRRQRG